MVFHQYTNSLITIEQKTYLGVSATLREISRQLSSKGTHRLLRRAKLPKKWREENAREVDAKVNGDLLHEKRHCRQHAVRVFLL